MQTGVLMEFHLGRLFLILLIQQGMTAPGFPAEQGEPSEDTHVSALANPFGSGETDRRLLQSFIQPSGMDDQKGPEMNTWKQEVFFLFHLYDYDKNGLLDGLELMKLVSEYNYHVKPGVQNLEEVVRFVDHLLQTQDKNHNGLLAPIELLSPPLSQTQNLSNDDAPHEEQAVEMEEKLPNQRQSEEAEMRPRETENPPREIQTAVEDIKQVDEQQIPEVPAGEHGQDQHTALHQGQTEI